MPALYIAVAVVIIVTNHALQTICMVCVGNASQVPYKNSYKCTGTQ
jgi:hypothetical protein